MNSLICCSFIVDSTAPCAPPWHPAAFYSLPQPSTASRSLPQLCSASRSLLQPPGEPPLERTRGDFCGFPHASMQACLLCGQSAAFFYPFGGRRLPTFTVRCAWRTKDTRQRENQAQINISDTKLLNFGMFSNY
jgi:hypothetical protein